jgi:hypothetical protein
MATATLTAREARDRQVFIDAAYERDPAAGKAVAIRQGEATWREWRGDSTAPRPAAAALDGALTAAVTAAVAEAVRIRKAQRKAAKRAARETAARRLVLEEHAQMAAQFTEAALSKGLRESSNADLAVIATIAETGHSPFWRAAPGAARSAALTESERQLEEKVNPPGLAERLASASPEALREDLRARLTVNAAATGLNSPFWRD